MFIDLPDVSGEFKTATEHAAPEHSRDMFDITIEEAIQNFYIQSGYRAYKDDTRPLILHEVAHVLADATDGLIKNEGQAAIVEMHLFGNRFSNLVPCPDASGEIRKSGKFKALPLCNDLQSETRIWCDRIQQVAIDEERKRRNDLGIDGSYNPKKLDEVGYAKAKQRSLAIKNYFEAKHGRVLLDYDVSEILEMKLSDFGLGAVMCGNKVRFTMQPHILSCSPERDKQLSCD